MQHLKFDQPLRRLFLARTALASVDMIRPSRPRTDLYCWEDEL